MSRVNAYGKMVDGGKVLALGALLTGIYMYISAQSFSREVARFPQFVAVILIVGSLLILAENILPEPLRILIRDDSDDQNEFEETSNQTPKQKSIGGATIELFSFEVDKAVFTFGSCVYYVVISYIIGIFYATPVFAMTYMCVTDKSLTTIVGFGILGYILAYLFTKLLSVQLVNGVLVT